MVESCLSRASSSMGNANGREDGVIGSDDRSAAESGVPANYPPTSLPPPRAASTDPMAANSPPPSPGRSRSPVMFAPQVVCVCSFFYF